MPDSFWEHMTCIPILRILAGPSDFIPDVPELNWSVIRISLDCEPEDKWLMDFRVRLFSMSVIRDH
jgi:hypothetical protein